MGTTTSSDGRSEAQRARLSPKQIIAIVLAVAAVAFVVQNSHKLRMTFLFIHVEMPVWIAFVVLLLVGFLIGYLVKGSRVKSHLEHSE
jgi:uncharacterized integral membrane protein